MIRMGPYCLTVGKTGQKTRSLQTLIPTAIGNRSYGIGNYYGLFPYDVISVFLLSTYRELQYYGYVLVHSPVSRWCRAEPYFKYCLYYPDDPFCPVPDHSAGIYKNGIFSASPHYGRRQRICFRKPYLFHQGRYPG